MNYTCFYSRNNSNKTAIINGCGGATREDALGVGVGAGVGVGVACGVGVGVGVGIATSHNSPV